MLQKCKQLTALGSNSIKFIKYRKYSVYHNISLLLQNYNIYVCIIVIIKAESKENLTAGSGFKPEPKHFGSIEDN